MKQKSNRAANFELLKIFAIFLVVSAHYMDKGGVLPHTTGAISVTGNIAWLVEAVCFCSINAFVLVSGYFAPKQEGFKLGKVISFYLELLFYSLLVGVIAIIAGVVPRETLSLYELLKIVFPISTEQYWFANAYLIVLCISPFLNAGIRSLTQKQFRNVLFVLLFFFSVVKTVVPIKMNYDNGGNNALWLIIVYLVGAYIAMYWQDKFKSKKLCLLLYAGFTVLIFLTNVALRAFNMATGKLGDSLSYAYSHNHLFTLMAAVMIFCFFRNLSIPDGKLAKIIKVLSGGTLGVYLIHEHCYIRYEWQEWLGVQKFTDTPLFLVHMLLCVTMIFLVCTGIDIIRQKLFRIPEKWYANRKRKKEN